MNVLALDTSMGACSAAVLRCNGDASEVHARAERMARGHAEALMPMVAQVMHESGLRFSALDVIAATTGPGSFTGVRIAISAARALALVTGAKLFGSDSLTVMARQALSLGAGEGAGFAIAVDARRGMLYCGFYDGAARKIDGPLLMAPDTAVQVLPNATRTTIGSGAALLAEAASRNGILIETRLLDLEPDATALAEIAAAGAGTVTWFRPLYLRPPEARPQAKGELARQ